MFNETDVQEVLKTGIETQEQNESEDMLQQAKQYAGENDYENAVLCLKEVLNTTISNTVVPSWQEIKELLLAVNDYESAEDCNNYEDDDENPNTLFKKGTMIPPTNEANEVIETNIYSALACFIRIPADFPLYTFVCDFIGVCLNHLKKHDEAFIFFKRVIELDPTYDNAYRSIAEILFAQNKHKEVLEWCTNYVTQHGLKKNEQQAWVKQIYQASINITNPKEKNNVNNNAAPQIEQSDIQENDAQKEITQEQIILNQLLQATELSKQGNFKEAAECYEKLLKDSPNSQTIKLSKDYYLKKAEQAQKAAEFEKTMKLLLEEKEPLKNRLFKDEENEPSTDEMVKHSIGKSMNPGSSSST